SSPALIIRAQPPSCSTLVLPLCAKAVVSYRKWSTTAAPDETSPTNGSLHLVELRCPRLRPDCLPSSAWMAWATVSLSHRTSCEHMVSALHRGRRSAAGMISAFDCASPFSRTD